MDLKADVVIVGGGLAGALTALRIVAAKPGIHVVLVEAEKNIGGHQTWCFNESDLDGPDAMAWLKPLVAKSWTASTVQFPKLQRTLSGGFHALRSDDLHKHVLQTLGQDVRLNARAERISESHVELENDHILAARCILDARGLNPAHQNGINGFQKSIAIDVTLSEAHGLTAPVRIDATCPQLDGLRSFRILPWDEKSLVVAECFYSDSPDLNRERIVRSIQSFVERRGWRIAELGREEQHVMPIPMTANYLVPSLGGEATAIGLRGGYFHASTGRLLPDAVRVADFISKIEDLSTANVREGLVRFRRSSLSRQRFYRLLNRWLFYASEPTLRYTLMQYFFSQPEDLLERFEAGRTTWSDRLRLLSGRPPVPLDRAFRSVAESAIQSWAGARTSPTPAEPSPQ